MSSLFNQGLWVYIALLHPIWAHTWSNSIVISPQSATLVGHSTGLVRHEFILDSDSHRALLSLAVLLSFHRSTQTNIFVLTYVFTTCFIDHVQTAISLRCSFVQLFYINIILQFWANRWFWTSPNCRLFLCELRLLQRLHLILLLVFHTLAVLAPRWFLNLL